MILGNFEPTIRESSLFRQPPAIERSVRAAIVELFGMENRNPILPKVAVSFGLEPLPLVSGKQVARHRYNGRPAMGSAVVEVDNRHEGQTPRICANNRL